MKNNIILVLILSLLTGCSGGYRMGKPVDQGKPVEQTALAGSKSDDVQPIDPSKPVVQIALAGSELDNYLFKVYADKKAEIICTNYIAFQDETKRFGLGSRKEKTEIFLTEKQYNELLNCTDNFIKEDLDKIKMRSSNPSQNFTIIAKYGEEIKRLDGGLFVSIDKDENFIQTEMAQNLMLILNEISPKPIVFVRNPY